MWGGETERLGEGGREEGKAEGREGDGKVGVGGMQSALTRLKIDTKTAAGLFLSTLLPLLLRSSQQMGRTSPMWGEERDTALRSQKQHKVKRNAC